MHTSWRHWFYARRAYLLISVILCPTRRILHDICRFMPVGHTSGLQWVLTHGESGEKYLTFSASLSFDILGLYTHQEQSSMHLWFYPNQSIPFGICGFIQIKAYLLASMVLYKSRQTSLYHCNYAHQSIYLLLSLVLCP